MPLLDGPPLGAVDASESIDQVFTDLSGGSAQSWLPERAGHGDADAGGPARVPGAPPRRRTTVEDRPYSEPGDLRAMQRLAEDVWRRDPGSRRRRRRPRLDDPPARRPRGRMAAGGLGRRRRGRLELDQATGAAVLGGRPAAAGAPGGVFAWFEAEEPSAARGRRAGRQSRWILALERRGSAHDQTRLDPAQRARLEHLDARPPRRATGWRRWPRLPTSRRDSPSTETSSIRRA